MTPKDEIKKLLTDHKRFLYSLDIVKPIKEDLHKVFISFAAEAIILCEDIDELPATANERICLMVTERVLFLHDRHKKLAYYFNNRTNNPELLVALPEIIDRFMSFKERVFELLKTYMKGGIL